MSDQRSSLSPEELTEVLRKLDEALAEGQRLREQIVRSMRERERAPWPAEERRKKPRR